MAESARWYNADAQHVAQVESYDGKKMVDVTLRQARKHGFYPSVTSIMQIVANPFLEDWKQDQVLMSALTLPRQEDEIDDVLIARIKKDAKTQAARAADRGRSIHAAIQIWLESGQICTGFDGLISNFQDHFNIEAPPETWWSESPFVECGYAGTIDLLTETHIVDFKSREWARGHEVRPYDKDIWQVCAYRQGFDEDRGCKVIYIERNTFEFQEYELSRKEIEHGTATFNAMYQFWKCAKKYDPTESRAAA